MAKGSALLKWYKPSVDRYWLLLLAGSMWSLVGLGLCAVGCRWLSSLAWPGNLVTAIAGFFSGVLVYAFAFSRIVRRNLTRIAEQPARVCLFAFQAWRSYALIFVMMLTGWLLRHARLPILLLAAIYLAIGTALALASSLYYEQL